MTDPIIFYNPGETYEITINPSDKYQHPNQHAFARFNNVYTDVLNILEPLKVCTKYDLYFEFSEPQHVNPTSSFPRLHLHGTIKILDVFNFLGHALQAVRGQCDIQINKYRPEYWTKYQQKMVMIMEGPTQGRHHINNQSMHLGNNNIFIKMKPINNKHID